MAKRSRTGLIEDQIITLHFAYPTSPEEAEALNALKEAKGKKYLKTVERSRMIAEWYKAYRFMVETGKNELSDIERFPISAPWGEPLDYDLDEKD